MSVRGCLLYSYRVLLRLYPAAFRERFAAEMLEVAGASALTEWPLIFGDTSVAIVRSWLEGSPSTAVLAEPNAYLSLGESPVRAAGLFRGFVLSLAIISGLYYVSYSWPSSIPQCEHRLTHLVAPSNAQCSSTSGERVCR